MLTKSSSVCCSASDDARASNSFIKSRNIRVTVGHSTVPRATANIHLGTSDTHSLDAQL